MTCPTMGTPTNFRVFNMRIPMSHSSGLTCRPVVRYGLHKHPYEEIFIIQEGVATFTVGSATLDAQAGQVIIVPAEVPHKFMNLSDKQLKQIDIHVNRQFVTHWLED